MSFQSARRAGAAACTALLLASSACSNDSPGGAATPAPSTPSQSSTLPKIKQAHWRIEGHPAGPLKKLSKKDHKKLQGQRRRIAHVVKRVYDALFLDPSRRRPVVHRYFSRRAARALLRTAAGVPERAERVKTLARRARIGVLARKATQASVLVVVRARGRLGDRRFRVAHKSRLWLERAGRGWTAIAFDVDQGRAS